MTSTEPDWLFRLRLVEPDIAWPPVVLRYTVKTLSKNTKGGTMTAYRDRLNAGQHAPPPPPNEATIADLQSQLRLLGQPVSGTKQELIDRLEQATAQPTSEESDNE